MTPLSFEVLLDRHERILDWFRRNGVTQHHRFEQHRNRIRSWLAMDPSNRSELNEADRRQLLWSVCESIELVDAIDPIAGKHPDSHLTDRLKEAVEGPSDLYSETSSSNRGRNILFELVIAGACVRAGLPIEFGTNPDITVHFEGQDIHIQCKRPFTAEAIARNLRDAGKQLRRDQTKEGPKALQLIALSVSRLFNGGDRLMVIRSEDELRASLEAELGKVVSRTAPDIETLKRYGVSAIWLQAGSPLAIANAHPRFTFRQAGGVVPVAASTKDEERLRRLAKLIKFC